MMNGEQVIEHIGQLFCVFVNDLFHVDLVGCCSEEIKKSKFNSMIGLVDRERVDAELYDDYETVKAREVCIISFCYIGCVILRGRLI